MSTPPDAPGDDSAEDIPLPGLDIPDVPGRRTERRPARPYSATIAPTQPTIERFWSRIIKAPDSGCWVWTGAISDSYGRISWRRNGISRTESAHRFALLIADQLKDGVVAEHRCNEPLCVRVDPGHVIASTQSANLRYAIACGRAGATYAPLANAHRQARSIAVRAAVANGWDPAAYAHASDNTAPLDAPQLF